MLKFSLNNFADDIETARQHIAEYYSREFTDVPLYSTDRDGHRVQLNRVYVPVTWKRYQTSLTHQTEENLESFLDIFTKVFLI